jgi:hypothetical protein
MITPKKKKIINYLYYKIAPHKFLKFHNFIPLYFNIYNLIKFKFYSIIKHFIIILTHHIFFNRFFFFFFHIYKHNHKTKSNTKVYSIYKHNNNKCLLIIIIIFSFHIDIKLKRKKLYHVKLSHRLHRLPTSLIDIFAKIKEEEVTFL